MTSQNKGSQDPIPGFCDLGNDLWLYEPAVPRPTQDSDHVGPSLVILSTWMGAATAKRIGKYTAKYQEIFPNSALLVIRTTIPDMTSRSVRTVRARLAPARDAIGRICGTSSSPTPHSQPSILLHMFSNGGVNMAVQLVHSLQESGSNFPLGGIILDCCPGKPTLDRIYKATSYSLPQGQIAQTVGKVMLYPFVGAFLALDRSGLTESVFDFGETLNNPTLFGTDIKRLYLFSSKDDVVPWQDVQEHIDESRSRGYQVESVQFERGFHCALVREEPRYSKAIVDFWARRTDQSSPVSTKTERIQTGRVTLSSKL